MENQTITVTDLNTIRSIIDSRGAFHGAEMSEVGQLFDKLTAFLDAVVAQAKAQEEAEQSLSQGESK